VKNLVIAEIELEKNEVPFITDSVTKFPEVFFFPTPEKIGERYTG